MSPEAETLTVKTETMETRVTDSLWLPSPSDVESQWTTCP